jgi:hypothetical protein
MILKIRGMGGIGRGRGRGKGRGILEGLRWVLSRGGRGK